MSDHEDSDNEVNNYNGYYSVLCNDLENETEDNGDFGDYEDDECSNDDNNEYSNNNDTEVITYVEDEDGGYMGFDCNLCNTRIYQRKYGCGNYAPNSSFGVRGYDHLNFCSSCVNRESCTGENVTILPDEMLKLIFFYVDNYEDVLNMEKSGCFDIIGDEDTWSSKLHFKFPHVPFYMISQIISEQNTMQRVVQAYHDLMHKPDYIIGSYRDTFQSNELNYAYKGEHGIKVIYHYNGSDHNGYCSEPEDEGEVNEYLYDTYCMPKMTHSIDRNFLTKDRGHYMRCNETFYDVKSVEFIKKYDEDSCLKFAAFVPIRFMNNKEQLREEFEEIEDKYEGEYPPIKIICEYCGKSSVSTEQILKCRYC